jgi:hypothetical protein
MSDGNTIHALVHESELEGTDEEFLARNPEVLEAFERLVAEMSKATDQP